VIPSSRPGSGASSSTIRIAAAVILDPDSRMLVVRKRNTPFFMQPGGKLDGVETPIKTLARELQEELGCELVEAKFLGTFSAQAANEPDKVVEAALFRTKITGVIKPAAEIEEIAWIAPGKAHELTLAPLTRDHVVPLVLSRASLSASCR
jgi:8-oxo-dGTP diphosphatase